MQVHKIQQGGTGDCTDSQDDSSDTEVSLIGENEEDFEKVLIDGFLGFGLSLGNMALVSIEVILRIESIITSCAAVLGIALVVALCLRGGQMLTDVIQKSRQGIFSGERVIDTLQAACCLLSIIFFWLSWQVCSVALAGVGICMTFLLYGRFLVVLTRKALMFIVDLMFMYIGIAVFILSQFDVIASNVFMLVAIMVSTVTTVSFSWRRQSGGDTVNAEDSRNRSVKTKGNNHTLFLLGFISCAAVLIFLDFAVSRTVMLLVAGASIGFAGILSLISRQFDEHVYKDYLKKSISFCTAAFLLLLLLVPDEVRPIVLAVYLCYVCMNVIVCMNAVVETARFSGISPVWLFGSEGSIFFLGSALAALIFAAGNVFAGEGIIDSQDVFRGMCVVVVVLVAWMQIRVNYQVYPSEPVVETPLDDTVLREVEHEAKRKSQWHLRLEAACEKYRLSPREREVLEVLLRGRDTKYIMDKFYISQSTAKTNIYNIYRKLDVHSRQELLDVIEDMSFPGNDLDDPDDAGQDVEVSE